MGRSSSRPQTYQADPIQAHRCSHIEHKYRLRRSMKAGIACGVQTAFVKHWNSVGSARAPTVYMRPAPVDYWSLVVLPDTRHFWNPCFAPVRRGCMLVRDYCTGCALGNCQTCKIRLPSCRVALFCGVAIKRYRYLLNGLRLCRVIIDAPSADGLIVLHEHFNEGGNFTPSHLHFTYQTLHKPGKSICQVLHRLSTLSDRSSPTA
jgi:hypothetical protein